MRPTSPEELARFALAVHAAGSELDLESAARRYRAQRPAPIGALELKGPGRRRRSLLDLLLTGAEEGERLEIELLRPPPVGPRWAFLRPFHALQIAPGGIATARLPGRPPQRAVARLYLAEALGPPSPPVPPEPLELSAFARWLRESSIVPASAALLLYYSEERVRYTIDLLDGLLLPDPRAGALDPSTRIRVTSREAWAIDRRIATGGFRPGEARLLETLAESPDLSEKLLEKVHGVGASARELLDGLQKRGLLLSDLSGGAWRWSLVGASAPAESAGSGESALKRSFASMTEEAERHWTCPLCGEEAPKGYTGLLCERCEALVAKGDR